MIAITFFIEAFFASVIRVKPQQLPHAWAMGGVYVL